MLGGINNVSFNANQKNKKEKEKEPSNAKEIYAEIMKYL
jgi:hypothetical protein